MNTVITNAVYHRHRQRSFVLFELCRFLAIVHTQHIYFEFLPLSDQWFRPSVCVCVCVYWVNMGLQMKAGRRKKKDFSFTFLYVYSYFTMFSPFLLLFFVWFIYSWETFQIMEVNDEHRKNTHNNNKKTHTEEMSHRMTDVQYVLWPCLAAFVCWMVTVGGNSRFFSIHIRIFNEWFCNFANMHEHDMQQNRNKYYCYDGIAKYRFIE